MSDTTNIEHDASMIDIATDLTQARACNDALMNENQRLKDERDTAADLVLKQASRISELEATIEKMREEINGWEDLAGLTGGINE
jgi:FtsZ-binding cell division protein ZapB